MTKIAIAHGHFTVNLPNENGDVPCFFCMFTREYVVYKIRHDFIWVPQIRPIGKFDN